MLLRVVESIKHKLLQETYIYFADLPIKIHKI